MAWDDGMMFKISQLHQKVHPSNQWIGLTNMHCPIWKKETCSDFSWFIQKYQIFILNHWFHVDAWPLIEGMALLADIPRSIARPTAWSINQPFFLLVESIQHSTGFLLSSHPMPSVRKKSSTNNYFQINIFWQTSENCHGPHISRFLTSSC